ncbi:MAG: TetR/AcrR family transcriptional regulator [Myxococcales bacterium]|nr:TetR/AcrR family transcriptional regulator [Myxococcales bacterium]
MKVVSKTRAKRREKTIGRIVEAALDIVNAEGFEALTMKRLADELGYAPGAFYRYFASKDELLLAVQRRVLEALAEDVAEAEGRARTYLARSSASAEVASLVPVLVAMRTYATMNERRPAHWQLLARWLGNPEPMVATEAAAPMLAGLVQLFLAIPRLFEEAVEAGALAPGDAQRRSFVLWTALQGALQANKLDRFGVEALAQAPLMDELCRALFAGWGASEDVFADAWRRAKKVS